MALFPLLVFALAGCVVVGGHVEVLDHHGVVSLQLPPPFAPDVAWTSLTAPPGSRSSERHEGGVAIRWAAERTSQLGCGKRGARPASIVQTTSNGG